jgi:phosphatidylglycerophosphate synthase
MRKALPASVADLLTISRLGIALVVIPAAWSLSLGPTAILVTTAWLTDFLDGKVARTAGTEGRMGRWDMACDTAVGAGLVIGLTGAGLIPILAGVGAVVVFGAWFLTGNYAAAMLLQITGYLPLLALLWTERPTGWWLPFITAALIGIVDWRRLLLINIPNFLRGLAGRKPVPP